MTTDAWRELDRVIRSASRRQDTSVGDTDVHGAGDLPEPVDRYFDSAFAEGPTTSPAAVIEMRGHIRIGRWLPFRARQLLAPRFGTVWEATVASIIVGSDRYVGGAGAMDWKLFGLIPFVSASGPDVTRSAAERAAAESVWVPSAVAPGTGVEWTASGSDVISAVIDTDGHAVGITHAVDADGRVTSTSMRRWGDPDRTGSWGEHAFGGDFAEQRRFGPVTIPSRGEIGWHHGTDRWSDGAFFRFEITSYRPSPDAPRRPSPRGRSPSLP